MIILENISKIYQIGEVSINALKNVSLNIESGEMVSVMGSSGSGKSTLMNILGCLDVPTEGDYLFEGEKSKIYQKTSWPIYVVATLGLFFKRIIYCLD
jgi:putative ABC transport system ATP-binding protein